MVAEHPCIGMDSDLFDECPWLFFDDVPMEERPSGELGLLDMFPQDSELVDAVVGPTCAAVPRTSR